MRFVKYSLFLYACLTLFLTTASATTATCTYEYNDYVSFLCTNASSTETCTVFKGEAKVESKKVINLPENSFIEDGTVKCKSLYIDGVIEGDTLKIFGLNTTGGVCEQAKNYYAENPTPGVFVENEGNCFSTKLVKSSYDTTEETPTETPAEDPVETPTEIPTETPEGGSSTTKPEYEEDTFETSSFCGKPQVSGAFRAIGWIIYIAKILIPAIIIILGSIDFGKAVVSSKDDEIKKSAKSLIKRAAIGMLVFFIPTIMNLVIKTIGGEDIYRTKSGFGWCTYCMLHPSDDDCGNLFEIGGK